MPVDSRTHQIADVLREEILRGQYREGERLPSERDLAERFDSNRGAVREALKKLEQLGIADIRRGGARVAPLEEASLDVVGHLLDLSDPPDPDLVEQVLETFRGLTAMAVRLGAERATDESIEQAVELLERLTSAELDPEALPGIQMELSRTFIEASGNMVLKLMRRGLALQFMDRLSERCVQPRDHLAKLRPAVSEMAELLRRRDAEGAARLIEEGMRGVHAEMVASLRAMHARAGGASAAGARS